MGRLAHNEETGETLYLDESGEWKPARTAEHPETGERLVFDGSDWQPTQPKPQPQKAGGQSDAGMIDSLINTMSFGLGDYVKGGAKYASDQFLDLIGMPQEDKGDYRLWAKRQREGYEQENPKKSFGAGMVGAMVNPAAKPVGQYISGAKGLGATMGRSGLVGGGWAGTQALGESEGTLADRLKQMGEGAGYGAGFGLILPPAMKVGGYLWNQTLGRIPGLSKNAATQKLMEAAERDNLPTAQALENKVRSMGPRASLMDAGPNLRGLTYHAAKVPGKGKDIISKKLTERQQGVLGPDKVRQGGQGETLIKTIDDMVPQDYMKTKAGVEASTKAAPFYKQAYAANQYIDNPTVNQILKTPSGKRALRQAAKLMADDGKLVSRVDPELTAMLKEVGGKPTGKGVGRGLKLETLDYVKRALGDMEKAATDKFGKATESSRILTGMRNRLTNALDDADSTGFYKQARALAGEKFDEVAALERGVKWLKSSEFPSPEAMQKTLSGMSPKEQHLFRVGVAQQIKTWIGEQGVGHNATKAFLGKPNVERKMRMALGDDFYKKFMQTLENEAEMFGTRAHVMGGSRTAENLAAIEDGRIPATEIARAMKDFSIVNPMSWGNLVSAFGGKHGAGQVTGPMSDRLAGLLTGRTAKEAMPFIQNYNLMGQRGQGGHFFRDLLELGGASTIGSEVESGPLTRNLRKRNKR